MLQYFPRTELSKQVYVLTGPKAIMARARVLESFAERCGQPGAMHWLGYFLCGRGKRWKHPYLALLLRAGASPDAIHVDDLLGAALFFEYRVLGMRTWAFATDDVNGMRSVVAPEADRSSVAAIACEAMMGQGAHVVSTSYDRGPSDANEPGLLLRRPGTQWAQRSRKIRKQMDLADTFEETLGRLGKSTRFNMRYYRKRLLAKMPCEFVPDVCSVMAESELPDVNHASMNPVSLEECRIRYLGSCSLPGGFLVGLRAPAGQWLSLVGGWRQGTTVVLHWQVNAAGYEKDSIGTVMRSFFLEHEVERGSLRLIIYGGTSHSMQNSFDEELAWDLIVRRNTLRARLLRAVSRLVESPRGFTGRTNFLAAALRNPELRWHQSVPRPRSKHTGVARALSPATTEAARVESAA